MSINRVPVGGRASVSPPTPSQPQFSPTKNQFSPSIISTISTPATPGSSKGFHTPHLPGQQSDTFKYDGGGLGIMHEEYDIAGGNAIGFDEHGVRDNGERISMHNENDHTRIYPSIRQIAMLTNPDLVNGCSPARHDIHTSRASWISISILILSIYSTVFSGIWLILAIVQPRYGNAIHSGGKLTPTTASTIFALFAKTIELSFVTVFVTFLGQVLTRRSFIQNSKGVTIAELSMHRWVLQPGFMIARWQHVVHASKSYVGALTLAAAFVAIFYTTASDSLVAPHLKYGGSEYTELRGLVKASYANPTYIADTCKTPISTDLDPEYAGTTCLSILHSGQSYHNSVQYLTTWQNISVGGVGVSSDIAERPRPPAMLYDNTTVTGSWVQPQFSNMTALYEQYNRVINNVTMSMPHAGILTAAHDPINGILQPEKLAGVGEYYVRASVVSPTINVLCANMNATEIAPLIYVEWPQANFTFSSWPPDQKIAWYGAIVDSSLGIADCSTGQAMRPM